MVARHSRNLGDPDGAARDLKRFIDFSREELASGGPDHHLTEVADLALNKYRDPLERAWLVACYMGPYNVPGGLALHARLGSYRDAIKDFDRVGRITSEVFSKLPVRKERRPARSPARMAAYVQSALTWVGIFDYSPRGAWLADYERLWATLDSVKYVGRYSGMKLLEGLRRAQVTSAHQPDVRPHDAWSPRLALSHLRPERDAVLNGKGGDKEANDIAFDVWSDAGAAVIPNPFYLEVLLCDFKQALDGGYYPGRPLDSELNQLAQVRTEFPDLAGWITEDVLTTRRKFFPREHLGELQGWDGRRKELGATMLEHGYVWTDRLYDYLATTDLAKPACRSRADQ